MKNRHALICTMFSLGIIGFLPNQVNAKQFSIIGAMDVGGANAATQQPSDTDITPETTRSEISLASTLPAGSILVKTHQRKLYFILPNQRAIEYAVSVGREGFAWSGANIISRKAQWPDWRPPPKMIEREAASGHLIPDFVKGGPSSPLGARALYLGTSDYRIHGTDKPWSIGHASSSGCIRMMNADVIELYDLAKIGAKVVVY